MPGGPALVEAPRRSTHTRARHPTTTAEVVPLERSNTGNGGGGTARIALLRPMKVSERVFIGAFLRPSAPRSDTRAGCYLAMYDFLKRDWTPTHAVYFEPSRSLRSHAELTARTEHGEQRRCRGAQWRCRADGDAQVPARRRGGHQRPPFHGQYPRFPIGIPRTELSYRACSLARPGRHTSLTAASPSPSSR